MQRKTNSIKQSTSQAQLNIPASIAKAEKYLSMGSKNLIKYQPTTIDKLMKIISTL